MPSLVAYANDTSAAEAGEAEQHLEGGVESETFEEIKAGFQDTRAKIVEGLRALLHPGAEQGLAPHLAYKSFCVCECAC